MSEPTLRDVLDAVNGLTNRVEALEGEVRQVKTMVSENRDMLASLSVKAVRRVAAAGDD